MDQYLSNSKFKIGINQSQQVKYQDKSIEQYQNIALQRNHINALPQNVNNKGIPEQFNQNLLAQQHQHQQINSQLNDNKQSEYSVTPNNDVNKLSIKISRKPSTPHQEPINQSHLNVAKHNEYQQYQSQPQITPQIKVEYNKQEIDLKPVDQKQFLSPKPEPFNSFLNAEKTSNAYTAQANTIPSPSHFKKEPQPQQYSTSLQNVTPSIDGKDLQISYILLLYMEFKSYFIT